ncbi:MAG: SCO family protein [Gemmatimonadota bacterium]|nr:MAG: SCO family protein [Gemmatimonadota bacterium]
MANKRSNTMMKPFGRLSITSMIAVIGAAACIPDAPPRPDELRGTSYPAPLEKPDFSLIRTNGDTFDFRAETDGFVTLLFFGYTHCPDVCPIHMANIAAVLRNLPPDVSRAVKVVMVSTDPDRDTPDRFGPWLAQFDPSFVGLIGPIEEVNAIQSRLQLPPASKYGDDPGSYTVGHSARVIAFTADNRAHVSYPFGTRQNDWAHDLPLLVKAEWETR